MERLLILDSNSLLNRAFYAIPPLTNNEGIHTNAVYGFTNMLFKMREDIKQYDYNLYRLARYIQKEEKDRA